jgi:hypothetical protein
MSVWIRLTSAGNYPVVRWQNVGHSVVDRRGRHSRPVEVRNVTCGSRRAAAPSRAGSVRPDVTHLPEQHRWHGKPRSVVELSRRRLRRSPVHSRVLRTVSGNDRRRRRIRPSATLTRPEDEPLRCTDELVIALRRAILLLSDVELRRCHLIDHIIRMVLYLVLDEAHLGHVLRQLHHTLMILLLDVGPELSVRDRRRATVRSGSVLWILRQVLGRVHGCWIDRVLSVHDVGLVGGVHDGVGLVGLSLVDQLYGLLWENWDDVRILWRRRVLI